MYKNIIGAVCFLITSLLFAGIPVGFDVNASGRVSVSAEMARVINVERNSMDVNFYINRYTCALNSSDEHERVYGAWALQHFQSSLAFSALFARSKIETSNIVIKEICQGLSLNFELYGYELNSDYDQLDASASRRYVKQMDLSYSHLRFHDLALHRWSDVKKLGSGFECNFITSLVSRYNPELIGFILEILPEVSDLQLKEKLEIAILSWSGYNLKTQSIEDVSKDLQLPQSLSKESVIKRYILYFKSIGYNCDYNCYPETALAILFGIPDKKYLYRNEMALRMLSNSKD